MGRCWRWDPGAPRRGARARRRGRAPAGLAAAVLACLLLPAGPARGASGGPEACGGPAQPGGGPWPGESSLARRLDVIFLEGNRLAELCGKALDGIRVSTLQEGELVPIPFQIDETDPEGNLVLTGGEQASCDPDRSFDANDLLLFLARDLGPRAPARLLQAPGARAWEVGVTDPVDGSQGWAYVTCSCAPPPLNPDRYVRYTLEEGKVDDVETRTYTIRYPWGAYYADRMVLRTSANGEGMDFLDRLKTRGTFTLFFSLLKIRVNEEKMSARVVGYRAGPIRVVRRLSYWADLGLGLRSPKFEADIFYYDTFLNAPVTTHIPVRLDLFFSKAFGEIGTDYNHEAYGMIFKNSSNPEGALVDGRMSPQEEHLDLSMDAWRLVTGPQGTFFRGKIPENDLTPQVTMTVEYVDDITRPDPPECEPGQVGHVFDRVDVLRVKPGVYKTDVMFLIPPDYRPGDETLYMQWEKNPLRVGVQAVAPAPEAEPGAAAGLQ